MSTADPFARVDRARKAALADPAAHILPAPRRVRRLSEVRRGSRVLTPDGTTWEVVERSYVGPLTGSTKKWCWLCRQGNEYRKLTGSQALYALRLLDPE